MKAIVNGYVVTVTGKEYERGAVLYNNGKIIDVGDNIYIPENTELIDATGCYVTPGLIDCHTHISTFRGKSTYPDIKDGNEYSSPITPQVRAIDALYPKDDAIEVTRKAGFTTVYTGPGSTNLIGGMGCSLKLRGHTAEEMVIHNSEMMKFAFGENPKRVFGTKGVMPVTRMGNAALIRQTLFEAKEYSEKLINYEKGDGKKPEFNFKLEALLPVIRREMRCRIHAHRSDDILTAIRICKEFNLDFTIEHATEGAQIADVLSKEKVMCVVGPLLSEPMKLELWNARVDTPAILNKAGVKICLTADTDYKTQWLPIHVGVIIREGLPEKEAYKAVTINAAEVLKLSDRIGSLESGKDADIAVFNGHPFSNMTKCISTIIDGVQYKNI